MARACRLVSIILFIFLLVFLRGSAVARAADAIVAGVVVDQSGRAVPRAYLLMSTPGAMVVRNGSPGAVTSRVSF